MTFSKNINKSFLQLCFYYGLTTSLLWIFFDLIVLIQHAYILAFDCFGLISANILIKSFLETFYEKSK